MGCEGVIESKSISGSSSYKKTRSDMGPCMKEIVGYQVERGRISQRSRPPMFNHADLGFNHKSKLMNDQLALELMGYGWTSSGVPIKSLHVDKSGWVSRDERRD